MDNQKKGSTKLITTVVAVLVALGLVAVGLYSLFKTEEKPTTLGFESIGELATQAAYCTEVSVTEASQELFGVKIPFTQSKYIYSYDVIIKAGLDFREIKWSENGTVIEVTLPKAKILSNEIVEDSFKIYYENESVFRPITQPEFSEARVELKKNAEVTATENGLLENAQNNAKAILTGFFTNAYDLEEYEIKFIEAE